MSGASVTAFSTECVDRDGHATGPHIFDIESWLCRNCGTSCPQRSGAILLWNSPKEERTGFEPEFFAKLAKFEVGSFWFKSRNELICWAIDRYTKTVGAFLEIGCGTGFVSQGIKTRFPQLNYYGSEFFEEALSFAQARSPNSQFLVMDATSMPFAGQFENVGAFDVLEHIEDDTKAISEVYKSLKSGGSFVITVPQHQWLWGPTDVRAHHYRRYSKSDLCSKLTSAGFKIQRTTSFFSLLLPLMVLSRALQVISAKSWDENKEMAATTKVGFLDWIMAIELSLIKAGVAFPAGGSLLIVAQK